MSLLHLSLNKVGAGMPLNNIDLDDLVKRLTRDEIYSSDYLGISSYLLSHAPLARVFDHIQAILSQHGQMDKDNAQAQLTQEACSAQEKADTAETALYNIQLANDQLLYKNYEKLTQDFHLAIQKLERLKAQKEPRYEHALRNLEELRARNVHLLEQRNVHVHEKESVHDHGHPTTGESKVHRHSQRTAEHGHPLVSHSHHSENAQLLFELELAERRLRLAEQNATDMHAELDKIGSELLEKKKVAINTTQQFRAHVDNMQACVEREAERSQRNEARVVGSSDLKKLLSSKNFAELQAKIEQTFLDIEVQKTRLLQRAASFSFPIFLEQLEIILTGHLCHLNMNEVIALRSILKQMKTYQQITNQESSHSGILQETRQKMVQLERMDAQNVALRTQNSQLQLDNMAAENRRRTALNLAMFGVSSALLSAGVGYVYAVSPAFFILPGALGVLSFVGLVMALVYHCRHSNALQKIADNESTILKNNSTVLIGSGNEATLAVQIENAGQEINALENTIAILQSEKQQVLKRAMQVKVQPLPGQHMMFASEGNQEPPSAPPCYEEVFNHKPT
jgi:hypothetical protein